MRSFLIFACSLVVILLTGCAGTGFNPTQTSALIFSAAGGTYTSPQTVTISSTIPGAAIYYYASATPGTGAPILYTGPITVSSSETLEAAALSPDYSKYAVGAATYVVQAAGPTVSSTMYGFTGDAVGNAETATVATVTNPLSTAETLSLSVAGDASLTLVPARSCGSQLPAGGSCPVVVQYLPTASGTQTASVHVAFSGSVNGSAVVALTGSAMAAGTGTVASTTNPLVALYTVTPGFNASVSVEFGPDTSYGNTTSAIQTTAGTAPVSVEVGGMRANTTYHMRAQIAYADGNTVTDADHTFTTGSLPKDLAAVKLAVKTAPGMTPQPGLELVDPLALAGSGNTPRPYVTDLQGNIIWYYPWTDYNGSSIYFLDGIKQLPDGDFLSVIGAGNNNVLTSTIDPSTVFIREFDLIGNTIKQLTVAQLNSSLAAGGYTLADGSPLVLADFHHDVTPLPNGHWLIMANTIKTVNGTRVAGDVVVDVDTQMKPRFVWNEFDHFTVTPDTLGFPDWTHSNAIIYSPTDGNFLVSIRHLNLVVKVNYHDGGGDGSVLWRMGAGGDFALIDTIDPKGNDPVDWQYAQHAPSFVGSTTAGTFKLTLMDNGDDRYFKTQAACPPGQAQSCYTTVPVFQIDEDAKTATVLSRVTVPVDLYSNFGGNAEVLANGDLEYDLCFPVSGAQVIESLQDSNHTLVWSLIANGASEYRAFRIPSLYPGVQWQ